MCQTVLILSHFRYEVIMTKCLENETRKKILNYIKYLCAKYLETKIHQEFEL